MNSAAPPVLFTHQRLLNWAGARVVQDAQTLFERGLVQDVVYSPPWVTGTILWSNRPLRTAVRVLPDGSAENHCPCRDNTERGIICPHVVALCLELMRRASDPEQEARRRAEIRRAAHLARIGEDGYPRRARPGTPGSTPAHLRVTLEAGWQAAAGTGRIPLRVGLLLNGVAQAPSQLDPGVCLALSPRDETLLYVLEDIAGGPVGGRLEATPGDFVSLLHLHQGGAIAVADGPALPVGATRLGSYLHIDLDHENGELLLNLHTEVPFGHPSEAPLYFTAGRMGWVFGGGGFWPLEQVLPAPLRRLYDGPVVIPRSSVPLFLQEELPNLARLLRVASEVREDLFTIEPGEPQFRLLVRGSPASLSAVLTAEYGDHTIIAARDTPEGRFAIPDPADILRYTVRNLPAEVRALETLARTGLRGEAGDALSPIVGCREVLNFLGGQLPVLRRLGWRVELEGRVRNLLAAAHFATPVVRIRQPDAGANWFEVECSFEGPDGARLAPAEIQRALLKGEAFLARDQQTVLLDTHAIQSLNAVLRDCGRGAGGEPGRLRVPLAYAAYVKTSLDALDGVDVEADPQWRRLAEQQARESALEAVPLPPELEGVLRPYQKEGVRWLRFLEGRGFAGILADEMGLGKTLQTLAWLSLERCLPAARNRPVLVVCPTSLVDNWAEEARRFVPGLRVLTLTGADRHDKWPEVERAQLVITSYALLRRDVERYLAYEFAAVVLDEAQHIKNPSTQNAMTAKELRAHHRLVLTGTPLENRVTDVWSIMDFLMPEYLGTREEFHQSCELPIAQGGPEAEEAQWRLRRKLQPFLLRRLKRDVAAELPPRIERIATCPLSPDQQAVYRELVAASRSRLTELVSRQGYARSRMEVLKTLLRLRQVCCHLALLRLPGLELRAPSAKLELFWELLDEALDGGHRVLVFSQFVAMLSILRTELAQRQIACCYLDGATRDRLAVVREFNTNRRIPVFLISLKAGGTGLNLTGADMVIHYDPWWNPAVEDQATDRAHRIGQKRTVYSVKLITQGTVEEKVLAMQRRKKALIDSTLAPTESFFHRLSWQDVLELLAL